MYRHIWIGVTRICQSPVFGSSPKAWKQFVESFDSVDSCGICLSPGRRRCQSSLHAMPNIALPVVFLLLLLFEVFLCVMCFHKVYVAPLDIPRDHNRLSYLSSVYFLLCFMYVKCIFNASLCSFFFGGSEDQWLKSC